MEIGFSTGSLALGNFKAAITLLKEREVKAIELSSLRENELVELLNAIDQLDLSSFNYISFHAPSKLNLYSEEVLVNLLLKVFCKNWLIIVHPDIITNFPVWEKLGKYLCIENMDKRKNVGRTSSDLQKIFDKLPQATFCMDFGHAKQIDPTMTEALLMLKKFNPRLKQIHLSEVNSQSHHELLNLESILAYSLLEKYVSKEIPIILESPVDQDQITSEIEFASLAFDSNKLSTFLQPYEHISKFLVRGTQNCLTP